jgi:hypothetical protein
MEQEISAKEFFNRNELENHVRQTFGLTPEEKKDVVIVGTKQELQKLQLSDKNIFWGIKCVCSDSPRVNNMQKERPNRGKIYPFGLDGNKEQSKKIIDKLK